MARRGRPRGEGRRKPSGDLVRTEAFALPPPERGQHNGGVVLEHFEESAANGRTMLRRRRMVARWECELDRLLALGLLVLPGETPEDGERRHKAGMRLREMHLRVHPTEGCMKLGRQGGRVQLKSGWEGWSESKGATIATINRALRRCGRHALLVESVCCDDLVVHNISALCAGLDAISG